MSRFFAECALYARSFAGMLVIVNPLGGVPVFLSLGEGRRSVEYRQIARHTAQAVATILLTGLWGGDLILAFFGIPALRTGGGLLLLFPRLAG